MIEATFIIGAILFVVMIQTATTKQLQKMKRLERMFKQHEQSGLSIAKFCKKKGIHQSKFHYWKQRYKKQKEAGLIDCRRGLPYKITKERRKFIIALKIKDPLLSSKDIAVRFEKTFRIKLTPIWVSHILREENLNDPVGRKTGKPIKKTRK